MSAPGMLVDLAGLCENAAAIIPPRRDPAAYAFMLEEVARHVRMVRNGEATLAEFASLYKLEPTCPTSAAT